MKLKASNRSAVQSLGRQTPVDENAGAVSKATGNALSAAGEATAAILIDREEEKAAAQMAEVAMEMSNFEEEINTFFKEDEYDTADIPSKYVTPGMKARGTAHVSEFEHKVYEDLAVKKLKETAKIIDNDYFRGKFLEKAELAQQEVIKTRNIAAVEEQNKQRQIRTAANIQTLAERGQYEAAQALIPLLTSMPDEEKKTIYQQLNQGNEIQPYGDSIRDQNVEDMTSHRDFLAQSHKDYLKDGGFLGEVEQQAWWNKLDAELKAMEKAKVDAPKNMLKLLKDDIRTVGTNATNNQFENMESFNELFNRADALGLEEDDPVLYRELMKHSVLAQSMDRRKSMTTDQRTDLNNGRLAKLDVETDYHVKELIRAEVALHNKAETLEQKDPIQAGQTYQYPEAKDMPVLNPGDPEYLENLSNRPAQARRLTTSLNSQPRIMSDKEIELYDAQAARMSKQEQVNQIMVVTDAILKEGTYTDVEMFFAEAGEGDLSGVMAVAGQRAIEDMRAGRSEANRSETILLGSNFLKNNPSELKLIDIDGWATDKISADIGNAFRANSSLNENTKKAALAAYAGLKINTGEAFDLDNMDMLNRAIDIATGGLVEYEGSPLRPPMPGVNAEQFENWYKNIDPDALGKFGYFGSDYTYRSNKDITDGIANGDYHLTWVAPNKYRVDRPADRAFDVAPIEIQGKTGQPPQPLIISYDPSDIVERRPGLSITETRGRK